MNEILDFVDGILDWPDDAHFCQRHYQEGVKNGNGKVAIEEFAGIRQVLLADDFRAALLHEDKAQDVGEPITQDKAGGEGRFPEPTDDPGEYQGDGPINEEVVPPGKRREHVANESHSAAVSLAFCQRQSCHAKASVAGRRNIWEYLIGLRRVSRQINVWLFILD